MSIFKNRISHIAYRISLLPHFFCSTLYALRSTLLLFTFFLCILPTTYYLLPTSYCSAEDLPTFTAKELIVIGHRLPTSKPDLLKNIPANVTVITAEEIEKSAATNLPELLRNLEGITVTDGLGFGLEARVDMRGFGGEAKNSLVLIDGVRLSEPYDNSLTWKLVSLKDIERIEIIRGGSSSIYGTGALGGVINIITKRPEGKPKIDTSAAFGNYGQQSYQASTKAKTGTLGYYLGSTYEKLDGYRQNSEYEGTNLLFKLNYDLGRLANLDLSVNHHNDRTGTAGGILKAARDQDPTQKNETALDSDGYNNRLNQYSINFQNQFVKNWFFSSNIFSRSRNQDSTSTYSWGSYSFSIDTKSWGITSQVSHNFKNGILENTAVYGLEYAKENIDTSTAGIPSYGLINNILGIYFQDDLTISNPLTLSLGIRFDKEDFDITDKTGATSFIPRSLSSTSPKFGVSIRPIKDFTFYGNISSSFKAPETNDLLFSIPGLFQNNPNIDPAKATNFEIGGKYHFAGKDIFKASLFTVSTQGEIIYNPYSFKSENFDTKRNGGETFFMIPLQEKGDLNFTYTLQFANFTSGDFKGKKIPLLPENKFTSQLNLNLTQETVLTTEWQNVANYFVLNDFNNTVAGENYSLVNLRLNFKGKNSDSFIAVKNLFNEKYSAFSATNAAGTVRYNPEPERTFLVGVSF